MTKQQSQPLTFPRLVYMHEADPRQTGFKVGDER